MKHPVRTFRLIAALLFVIAAIDVVVIVRYVSREQLVLAGFVGLATLIYASLGVTALIYADRLSGRKRD